MGLVLALTFLAGIHFPLLLPNKSVCAVRWEGDVDKALTDQVRKDLAAAADCYVLRVDLFSPGGQVIYGIEIVRLMEEAQNKGLTIEIHTGALTASAGTFILAAGSPGHRYAYRHTFTIVHGISQSGECYFSITPPKTDNERGGAALIETLVQMLVRHTGHSAREVRTWFHCDNDQYGDGWLLLKLGMADFIE